MSREEQLYWLMSNNDPTVPDSRDTSIVKKRRGRQPRQSTVSATLRDAIKKFASIVGAPILQPGGFRDFTGWLDTISAHKFRPAWLALSNAFLVDSATTHPDQIYQLKRDVVHEIISLVVKRKAHESSKLVSTNARRQSSIPPTGSTVMTIFESYLAVASAPYVSSPRHASGSPVLRRQQSAHSSAVRDMYPTSSSSLSRTISNSSDSRSSKSSSSSSGRPSASSMDISTLLSVTDVDDFGRSMLPRSKLPSLSQLDAQLRARSEKESRAPR